MYLSLLEPTATLTATGPTGLQSISIEGTSLRLGVVLAARHGILLGLGITASVNTGPQSNGAPSDTVQYTVMPTYRFFVLPLRESGLAMYVDAHGFIGRSVLGGSFF